MIRASSEHPSTTPQDDLQSMLERRISNTTELARASFNVKPSGPRLSLPTSINSVAYTAPMCSQSERDCGRPSFTFHSPHTHSLEANSPSMDVGNQSLGAALSWHTTTSASEADQFRGRPIEMDTASMTSQPNRISVTNPFQSHNPEWQLDQDYFRDNSQLHQHQNPVPTFRGRSQTSIPNQAPPAGLVESWRYLRNPESSLEGFEAQQGLGGGHRPSMMDTPQAHLQGKGSSVEVLRHPQESTYSRAQSPSDGVGGVLNTETNIARTPDVLRSAPADSFALQNNLRHRISLQAAERNMTQQQDLQSRNMPIQELLPAFTSVPQAQQGSRHMMRHSLPPTQLGSVGNLHVEEKNNDFNGSPLQSWRSSPAPAQQSPSFMHTPRDFENSQPAEQFTREPMKIGDNHLEQTLTPIYERDRISSRHSISSIYSSPQIHYSHTKLPEAQPIPRTTNPAPWAQPADPEGITMNISNTERASPPPPPPPGSFAKWRSHNTHQVLVSQTSSPVVIAWKGQERYGQQQMNSI